jgi:hypothetical protein
VVTTWPSLADAYPVGSNAAKTPIEMNLKTDLTENFEVILEL